MGRSVMFDVGRCASWTKNEIDFARWWRLEVDRDMVDRADMIKELAMIRGVVCAGLMPILHQRMPKHSSSY